MMNKSMNIAGLVTGTALEILSATIIYAGIDNKDNIMISIGAAMFLIGFVIMRFRGEVKKKEKFAEEKKLLVQLDKFIEDYLPDDIRATLTRKLYAILGVEDLTGPDEPEN